MHKYTYVLLLAVAAVCVQGQNYQLQAAAQAGRWDEFNRLQQQQQFGGFGAWPMPQPHIPDIKTLKPGPGAQVYGQSISAFKSTSTVNGRRTEYSAGHKVINNNGKVVETDFKPKK